MTNIVDQTPGHAERVSAMPSSVTRRLLASAIAIIAARGYEAASVAAIARRSGLTTGAIYSRWTSKREMFIAAVEHIAEQRMAGLTADAAAGTGLVERHMGVGAGLPQSGRDDARSLWIEACVSAARDPELRETVGHLLEDEAKALGRVVADAKAGGAVDPALSTEAIAVLCQAVEFGFHLMDRVQTPSRDIPSDADMDALMSRLYSALAPPSPNGHPTAD